MKNHFVEHLIAFLKIVILSFSNQVMSFTLGSRNQKTLSFSLSSLYRKKNILNWHRGF